MKDKIRDIAIRIVDDLVENKLIKDCIDTNGYFVYVNENDN